MKILLINGSHRHGNTDILTQKISDLLRKQNQEVSELKLREIEIRLPDGCENCAESEICPHIHDQFSREIEPGLRNFDLYILATPTWDDGVTPLTKIFWDRIVSWCHPDRMYLKDKSLAVITHGMAGDSSWKNVTDWVKSICVWEKCRFGGSLCFKSAAQPDTLEYDPEKAVAFVNSLLSTD